MKVPLLLLGALLVIEMISSSSAGVTNAELHSRQKRSPVVVIPAAICAAGKVKDLVAHLKQKYPKEYERIIKELERLGRLPISRRKRSIFTFICAGRTLWDVMSWLADKFPDEITTKVPCKIRPGGPWGRGGDPLPGC